MTSVYLASASSKGCLVQSHTSIKETLPGGVTAALKQLAEGTMTTASILQRLKRSLVNSAGTIVFGMEDGTVSIFGLIFGVAATTTSSHAVLIAGASGAAAAAVAMMAGAYLETETRRDAMKASRARLRADLKHNPASTSALLEK